MSRRLITILFAFMALAMSPLAAIADDKLGYDGRVEGYARTVVLDGGSEALLWLLMIALGILALAVLFKNAKRTHLD